MMPPVQAMQSAIFHELGTNEVSRRICPGDLARLAQALTQAAGNALVEGAKCTKAWGVSVVVKHSLEWDLSGCQNKNQCG